MRNITAQLSADNGQERLKFLAAVAATFQMSLYRRQNLTDICAQRDLFSKAFKVGVAGFTIQASMTLLMSVDDQPEQFVHTRVGHGLYSGFVSRNYWTIKRK
jgi:hypothetical protein